LGETFERLHEFKGDVEVRDRFLEEVDKGIDRNGKDYLSAIQGLEKQGRELGTGWLQGIVDHVTAEALKVFPAFSYRCD
jgi:hypothetical protein